MSAQPRTVYLESRYVLKDAHDEVLRVCGNLLKAGKQFSVSPWPNDIHSTAWSHWVISWPAPHVTYQGSTAP